MNRSRVMDVPVGAWDRMERADETTAASLHARYLQDVFRYVAQRVDSVVEAEDITAEVFAAAAAGLPRFRGECPPFLWLLSIARRQIAMARRRRSTRRETLSSEMGETASEEAAWEPRIAAVEPEAAALRVEARQVLDVLLARLKADQREALMLQYWEQFSVAEIAVVMERSPASVKSLLQRAREALHRWGRGYFLEADEEGRE